MPNNLLKVPTYHCADVPFN